MEDPSLSTSNRETPPKKYLSWRKRLIPIEPGEGRALFWASLYFFFLLLSYYLIRPIRGSYGSTKNVQTYLPWIATGTLIILFVLNPLYGALVSRFSRRRFVPWLYYFFAGSLIPFYLGLHFGTGTTLFLCSIAFSIWVGAFNVFIISIFWDVLVDVFNQSQGKRLFGFISSIGNLGAILASVAVEFVTRWFDMNVLLLTSAVTLLFAIFCAKKLDQESRKARIASVGAVSSIDSVSSTGFSSSTAYPALSASLPLDEKPPGAGTFSFVHTVFRTPYLLGICGYVLLVTLLSSFIYVYLGKLIVAQGISKPLSARYFARIDLVTNLLNSLLPFLFAKTLLKRLDVGKTLAILPVFLLAFFGMLWLLPTFKLLILVLSAPLFSIIFLRILTSALEFSIAKPARKVLFTIMSRDEKYSAQSFIDTFVYRISDFIAGWTSPLFKVETFHLSSISPWSFPIWVGWVSLSLYLGKNYKARLSTTKEGILTETA